MEFIVIIFFILAIILPFIWLINMISNNRCKKCGKNFAFEVISKNEISREKCSKIELLHTKNKKGEIIRTRENRIYGQKIKYQVIQQCKYCKNLKIEVKEEEIY